MPGTFLLTMKGATSGDITGGAVKKEGDLDYSKGMLCHGYEYVVQTAIDPNSGASIGRRRHFPIKVRKEIDAASPKLMNMLTTNEKISDAKLSFNRADGKGKQQVFFTIEAQNGFISSYKEYLANDAITREKYDVNEQEEIEFTFTKIVVTYTQGGITATDDWNA